MTTPLVDRGREVWTRAKDRPHFLFTVFASVAAIVLFALWTRSSNQVSNRADRLTGVVESQQVLIESQQVLTDKLATQLDAALAQGAVVKSPEQVAAEVPGGAEVSPIAGAQGERGEAGLPGPIGEPGIGIAGSQGERGDTGSTGSQGATGETGTQGSPGIGVAGANGVDGGQGPSGPAGSDGAPGADGAAGTPGADGAPGGPGPAGPQGPPPSSWTFSIAAVNYQCSPTPDPTDDPTVFVCTVVP